MASEVWTWRQLGVMSRALATRLGGDAFLSKVFTGCIDVGKRRANPIRGNLVASGLREAVNHVIHRLAPDKEVRACSWFVQAEDTDTVTRRQRANYIIKGGLTDEFVADILHFDVKPYSDDLIEMITELNRVTHVRPGTLLRDAAETRRLFGDILTGVTDLLNAAGDSRDAVEDAVGEAMHTAIFDKLIGEAIQALDDLSTHTAVDHHWVDEIEVEDINSTTITYRVAGTVVVELQYGSGSDVRNGIGHRDTDDYPYEAEVELPTADPLTVTRDDIEVRVDTSSFYE